MKKFRIDFDKDIHKNLNDALVIKIGLKLVETLEDRGFSIGRQSYDLRDKKVLELEVEGEERLAKEEIVNYLKLILIAEMV